MKRRTVNFIIFFSIAIAVFAAINVHIFFAGRSGIPGEYRSWYTLLFIFFSASLLVGRFVERFGITWLSDPLVWVGSFWLAAMAYFFLILLCIDLLRLINYIIPYFPSIITNNPVQTRQVTVASVFAIVAVTVLAGYLNARSPRVKTLDLTIPKNSHGLKSLNIAVASDIHLGTLVCKARLEEIVRDINALNPDVVLLPGDVVDEDLGPVIRQNLGETLRSIQSKYGVYAITGNHEYIGGVEAACRYLTEHGIVMLRDSSIEIAGSFTLVGREDRSLRQFEGKRRKPLEEIMAAVDKSLPIILMDHQPFQLDEAVKNGVDLQLSGHTHHGQLWPFNFITEKVYELSWGYMKKGNTHFYVSCGVGTWGPPVRTGNTPEIMNVRLRFE
jgi:predicted MPP superfamily phosphohydrolase